MPKDNMTELLIVDFGDCCVVKVEKGEIRFKVAPTDNGGMGYLLVAGGNEDYTDTILYRHPFSEVRAALDGGEKPPVPRIEKSDNPQYDWMLIHDSEFGELRHDFDQDEREAFSQLAGQPLPIYRGRRGEWTEYSDYDLSFVPAPCPWVTTMPFKVYRYRRP